MRSEINIYTVAIVDLFPNLCGLKWYQDPLLLTWFTFNPSMDK